MPNPVIHPGRVLLEHMLASDWSLSHLAAQLEMSPDITRDFLLEFGDLTPELATKLAALLGTSKTYWLNLQQNYDKARNQSDEANDVSAIAFTSDVKNKVG